MLLRPDRDVGRAALEHGDVERVDAHLLQDLGAPARCQDGARRGKLEALSGCVSRSRRCSVQAPPRSTFDGTPGSGISVPNSPPPPWNSNAVT